MTISDNRVVKLHVSVFMLFFHSLANRTINDLNLKNTTKVNSNNRHNLHLQERNKNLLT